ncbi:MAG: Phosphorylated carbohydrates phosphatase [Verrucomicrobiae bacterium]|nr:Phosphorylated carbohydrates phosphatase [Verrucomicrobiae bacterium]
MKSFRAVIFDMDGVLIDSEPLHSQAWQALFADLGHAHGNGVNYRDYIGVSDMVFLKEFLAKNPLPQTAKELHSRKLQHLYRLIREHRPIYHELHSLVPALAQKYRLAVASSSNQEVIDVVLEVAGLTEHFKVTVGGNAVEHHKPHPDVYLLAAKNLGIPAAQCCAIEDSPVGIAAAKSAGLTAIGITTGLSPDKLTGADHIARNFAEVRQLLL